MNFKDLKNASNIYAEQADRFSKVLNQFQKLPNGLIPDEIRATEEYKEAKRGFDHFFNLERQANSLIMKHFKKENRKYHEEKRAAKLNQPNKQMKIKRKSKANPKQFGRH